MGALSRFWRTNGVVLMFALVGFAAVGGLALLNGRSIERNCRTLQEGRDALRTFVSEYAEPLPIASDAEASLVVTITDRNEKYAAQRNRFFRDFPEVTC